MPAIDSALAGLRAAERKHTTAARQVADWAEDVATSSESGASYPCMTEASSARLQSTGEAVDLAHALVDQMLAGVGFRAALRVIETDASMRGTLVDLKA